MADSPKEAITSARRLIRTFASAPGPRRQARAIHSALSAAEGWSMQERQAIDQLGAWLSDRPDVAALRIRCDQVLGVLLKAHDLAPRPDGRPPTARAERYGVTCPHQGARPPEAVPSGLQERIRSSSKFQSPNARETVLRILSRICLLYTSDAADE